MRRTGIFDNCRTGLEEIPNPQTGERAGWSLIIFDDDDDTVYRLPLAKDLAEDYAARILGLGERKVIPVGEVAARRVKGGRKQ